MSSKSPKDMDVDERQQGIGQGELYFLEHAIKHDKNKVNLVYGNFHNNNINDNKNSNIDEEKSRNGKKEEKIESSKKEENSTVGRGVVMDVKNRIGTVKDRLMEKLAAASVPSDASENVKQLLETVIRDVTPKAEGITKDALQRIKSHLADILPSLSPSLTSKMVDDAEKEAAGSHIVEDKKTR